MESQTPPPVLEIKNLSKAFGRHTVLDGVSLSLKKGSVLALMGENGAGKSTLMKCLFGLYRQDEGQCILEGKTVHFRSPKDALEKGVSMVHQELNQCMDRSVCDNLYLGRYPGKFGIVNESAMFTRAKGLFKSLSMEIDPRSILGRLSVSQRQMVEIAKAVSFHAKVIILDEPTSSLTENEVEKLFAIIRNLQSQGVSFIYISHKMDEIFKICSEIAVLRDGSLIMQKETKDTSMDEIIRAMVGRKLENRFPPVDNIPGGICLEVSHLSNRARPMLDDISFSVRKGEIFGIYGLVGSGRSELLETLFGLMPHTAGSITCNGKKLRFNSSRDAMKEGFALVTEERKVNGMFLNESITFNTTITCLEQFYNPRPFLSDFKQRLATGRQIKTLNTKCLSPDESIATLSGGNQQKVILGKWLERNPSVLLLDEPTRGIDVGAKYEIYELIRRMAKAGSTIIIVSSEMPELLGITNRIAVMSNFRLSGIVDTKNTSQEELFRMAAAFL